MIWIGADYSSAQCINIGSFSLSDKAYCINEGYGDLILLKKRKVDLMDLKKIITFLFLI